VLLPKKCTIFLYFRGAQIHWESLCIVEGIFRFLQDIWFVLAVFVLILGDQELGQDFPGKTQTIKLIKRFRGKKDGTNNVATTYYNDGGQQTSIEETSIQ
jgi:hypothetical protein